MACSTRIRCKIFYGMHLYCSAIDETIVLRAMHWDFHFHGGPTCKNPPTDQTVHQKWSILAGYVENGLLYTKKLLSEKLFRVDLSTLSYNIIVFCVELCWAVLSGVELCWAVFSGVELCLVVLSCVELCWAVFSGVELCWAVFSGVELLMRCPIRALMVTPSMPTRAGKLMSMRTSVLAFSTLHARLSSVIAVQIIQTILVSNVKSNKDRDKRRYP